MMYIRTLKPHEIEIRPQSVKEHGCVALLYKDARADMNVLDETFGVFGWKRDHEVINGNLFCNVSIWDKDKKQWVTKQDVGTESYTEKEKGQASDSFKRACFNWGIGRELYTAPFIWINLGSGETYKGKNGNIGVKTRFSVSEIGYNDNKEVNYIQIKDDKGKVRYTFGSPTYASKTSKKIDKNKAEALRTLAKAKKTDIKAIEGHYGVKVEDMTEQIYIEAVRVLNKK